MRNRDMWWATKKLELGLAMLIVLALLSAKAFCQSHPAVNSDKRTEDNPTVATTTAVGVVRTAQDIPVPGATVRLVHLASGRSWVSWTDGDGKFSFPGLPPGRYHLDAKQLGFGSSQTEADLAAGPAVEVQLTLRVDVSSTNAADTKREGETQSLPDTAFTPAPESANPAEGSPSAAANADAKTTTLDEKVKTRSGNAKEITKQTPLSASGALPADDAPSPLGEASASDAFLLGGTVNRSATLGGLGSFGTAGGSASSGNFDMSSAAGSEEFPVSGQGADSSTGGGKGSGRGGNRSSRRSQQRKMRQKPAEATNFGEGIQELWAQNRLSRLSADRTHFSFYNRYNNSVWDARPYSLTGPDSQKLSHYDDQFGMHLGGPMYLPHIYDGRQRTFFFVSYEMGRSTQPQDFFATVPTPSERNGDFSDRGAQLFDPTSSLTGPRTSFGSQIPTSRLNKTSLDLLEFIPMPNLAGFVQNFHLQSVLPVNNNRVSGKILHTISPRLNLSASYNANIWNAQNPNSLPQLTSNTSGLDQSVSLALTQNWTSHLINESRVNWSRNANDTLNGFAFNRNVVSELGIQGVSDAPIDWGVPFVHLTNFTNLNDPVAALRRNQTLRVMDNLTYTLSKHTIHTGAEIRWIQINTDSNPIPRGNFSFTGLMTSQLNTQGQPIAGTGLDFADFLMGFPQSTMVRFGDSKSYFRSREYIGYAQDDWRVHPRFAVTLGVRYELMTPPVESSNHIANLVLNSDITQVALVTPGLVNPFTGKTVPRSLLNPNTNNWSPRIGIAWRPPSKLPLVIRAGYGMFYNESVYNQLAASMANQPPFAEAQTRLTSTANVLTFQNGFPSISQGDVKNTVAVDPNYRVGYAQLWNFSVESQIKPTLLIEATYTGTKGTNLDLLRAPNRAQPGSPFNTELQRRIPNAPGFTYDTFGASSIYHAARLLVQRQMAHGLRIQGIYTFSKSIDNASSIGGGAPIVVQNDNNFAAERGLSSFDVRQQFRGGFTYELPFGPKQHATPAAGMWMRTGWVSAVLGNLQVSELSGISTGMPFTALLQGNAADNTGTGSNFSTRADQIANPNLPSGQRTPLHFFDTAAFTLPPALQFGDAARNTITGPGTFWINLALTKKFRAGQDGRIHTDLRWEVQNLTNTPTFVGLHTIVDSTQFGRVDSAKPMRSMDLMLRVNF